MENNKKSILEVEDLCVVFPQNDHDVVAVKNFTLTIHEGEIIGLIGETGCGKSTAVAALMRLVRPPGIITNGCVKYKDKNLLELDHVELRAIRGRDIGMIVQDPHSALNPMLRVGDQISNVYRAHQKASKREAAMHAVNMLKMVGINDPERRIAAYPHELSGGMAQRVLIAMALSSRPNLLIADEPTSGLDVTIQAQVLDELWHSVQQTGSAALIVTQDLGIIANYCDRVVVMHEGEIIEMQSVEAFFANPDEEYSKKILSLLRSEDQMAREHLMQMPAVIDATKKRPDTLLRVENLTKYYPIKGSTAQIQAVHEVSFSIAPGETLGLVGESGSGKTTVGRCILRLTEPTSGEIYFNGEPIGSIPQKQFRKYRSRLQIVFQSPFDALNPRWTVGNTLREPLDLHTDLSRYDKNARIRELMRLVGLPEQFIGYRPTRLSAGKRQRVAIARALATNPEFIVLDEPTSALAPAAHAEIIHLLMDLQEKLGLSYLFISHDLSTVKYLCHNVAVMYLSQVVEMGTENQAFNRPQHPYSKALLSAVLFPDPSDRRIDRDEIEGLEGEIPSPINLPDGCYLYSRCLYAVSQCKEHPQALVEMADGRSARCWRATDGDLSLNPLVMEEQSS